ncbi:MAG: sodium:proton antiporter [Planctomycetes bacterium]|nr:sodium:proton antiporter [Planctomycetota bacterium]
MAIFNIAAMLLVLAAVIGVINHRVFKLPHAIGLMVITLGGSLGVMLIDQAFPGWDLQTRIESYVGRVDFNKTLMEVLLSFLLFAGALHVKIEDLLARRFAIVTLATVGVLLSTAIVGCGAYGIFRMIGFDVGIGPCLVFGALISPTDPVAVMALLKTANAPPGLEAKIAGESLFNDGVGVVVFTVLVTIFGLKGAGSHAVEGSLDVGLFFLQEVIGGVTLGLLFGYIAYRAMKGIDEYALEVIITLALVMGVYALSGALNCSGPIAVVIAGLFIGNPGRRFAMSAVTIDQMEKFWSLLDEILNSVLFLLIGLEIFCIEFGSAKLLEAGLLAIPLVLIARFISVSIPISILKVRRRFSPGVIPILTWCGLRGGISVALVFSLEAFPQKNLLVVCTYFVVLFSVIVQGLTVKPLLKRYLD